jgi:hypothetical protein
MEIHQRLTVFFERLSTASAARDADEALSLVCRTIEAVEDEFCPVPRENPPPLLFTGRMYAPQADRTRRLANGTIVADTRRHRVYCQPNGAISIVALPQRRSVFEKPGFEAQ